MADLAEKGAISFEVGHEHRDWASNHLRYNFHLPDPPGLWIEAYKHANGILEVELKNYKGGFQTSIKTPVPQPKDPSSPEPHVVKAMLGWSKGGQEIILTINGETVAMVSGEPLDDEYGT